MSTVRGAGLELMKSIDTLGLPEVVVADLKAAIKGGDSFALSEKSASPTGVSGFKGMSRFGSAKGAADAILGRSLAARLADYITKLPVAQAGQLMALFAQAGRVDSGFDDNNNAIA